MAGDYLDDAIKIITYAPELDNDFELLTELKKNNVIPSMGHTNATYDESIHAITTRGYPCNTFV